VAITLRICSLAFVVLATACAHVGRRSSPALSGTYRFSDPLLGSGWVSGSFDVDTTGHVTKVRGSCSSTVEYSPGPTSVSCRVLHVGIAAHDDSSVRTVAIKVLVSETIPWLGDGIRSQVRNQIRSGHVSAARSAR